MRVRTVVAGGFRVYKRLVSPFMPRACRFHPTCSKYTAEAVDLHDALKKSTLAASRLLHCNP